jgi:hypothetical protein
MGKITKMSKILKKSAVDLRKEFMKKEIKKSSSNAGRPKKEDKKIQINVKVPPWLNEWMKRQPESKAVLIETALVSYYQIPESVTEKK